MAMKLYPDTAIQDIADAIRAKNGSSDTYTVSQMAQAIEDIPSGGGGSLPVGVGQMASGQVTFAARYQTNGNRLIANAEDIGFVPTSFVFVATAETFESIYNDAAEGTETAGVITLAYFFGLATASDTSKGKNYRGTGKLTGTALTAGYTNNTSYWTTSTNGHLYKDANHNVYFRTASNNGLPAGGTYYWLAWTEE